MTDNIFNIPFDNNPRVPVPDFPYRHMVDVQMRFNDTDMLGHVNNNAYLSYFDLGKTGYFNAVAADDVDWRHVNIVVANINVDFYAPTFLNEPVVVLTRVVAIGVKSLTMEQRLVDRETGQVKCMARSIMAGFNLETNQSQPIADHWIEKITHFEGHQLTK
ncbi:MAG: acyl-CoA thioesterase [Muribaculum sp.]|nr:acyl-CoA thioesterase [Muribaculaceae bacterium]MCM1080839.1 acyl-CoA thioesterase [Muribaculum sp.]